MRDYGNGSPGAAQSLAPGTAAGTAAPTRARVLLVARDRRYRAAASTLLARRGNTVLDFCWGEDVAEVAVRERIDVVLFDASSSLTAAARDAARLAALDPPIGIVAVSTLAQPGLAALPVLPKWTGFDEVFAAIERAGSGGGCEDLVSCARQREDESSFGSPRLAQADS